VVESEYCESGSGWRQRFLIVIVVISSVYLPCLGSELAPYLSSHQLTLIHEILAARNGSNPLGFESIRECYALVKFVPPLAMNVEGGLVNLDAMEKCYQKLIQPQIFSDLRSLYAPENESRVSITYGSFRANDEYDELGDLGFGLHLIRRLELPQSNGENKVVEVNEQWLQNPVDGGLFLPDEIRIKTLVFEGKRRVPGSESLYLFDSLKLGWGAENELTLARRTRSDFVRKYDARRKREIWTNEPKVMGVPVSSPFACINCHNGDIRRGKRFLAPGEIRDHESMIQASYRRLPLAETLGYRKYIAALERQNRRPEFIAQVKEALLHPELTLTLPQIVEKLSENTNTGNFLWLGSDLRLTPQQAEEQIGRRGVFGLGQPDTEDSHPAGAGHFRDAMEDEIFGSYIWWKPASYLPSSKR